MLHHQTMELQVFPHRKVNRWGVTCEVFPLNVLLNFMWQSLFVGNGCHILSKMKKLVHGGWEGVHCLVKSKPM